MNNDILISKLREIVQEYDAKSISSVNDEIIMWRKAYLDSLFEKERSKIIYEHFLAIPSKSLMTKKPEEWIEIIKKFPHD